VKFEQKLPFLIVDRYLFFWFRYIPRYTFSWLVQPMWLVLSMYTLLFPSFNFKSYFCESNMNLLFYIEFLHRAADLTLVPSVAIGKDLEEARVTAGEHKSSLSSCSWTLAFLLCLWPCLDKLFPWALPNNLANAYAIR
jgi:hypothetical protein